MGFNVDTDIHSPKFASLTKGALAFLKKIIFSLQYSLHKNRLCKRSEMSLAKLDMQPMPLPWS